MLYNSYVIQNSHGMTIIDEYGIQYRSHPKNQHNIIPVMAHLRFSQ